MTAPYAHLRLTIDTVSWTPVTAPFDCDHVVLLNLDTANSAKMRTTVADADTEKPLDPMVQEIITSPMPLIARTSNHFRETARFRQGTAVCYLQSAAGTGPIVATFLV